MCAIGIEGLASRVAVLERDVWVMKGILWPAPAPGTPAAHPASPQGLGPGQEGGQRPEQAPQWAGPAPAGPYPAPQWAGTQWTGPHQGAQSGGPPWAVPPASGRPAASGPGLTASREANFAGTWFARVGALAVLLGAGFAFKYGIDQGYITRGVRVAIGLLAGLAFVGWGAWARQRSWDRLAQAVTAGGVGICYLSVLVAHSSYQLISGPVALGAFVAITLGNGALAWTYNSVALAVLAAVMAYVDPLLASPGSPLPLGPLYTYLAVVDLGVLAVAVARRWRALDLIAMAGTWLLLGFGLADLGFPAGMAFATGALVAFVALPFLRNHFWDERASRWGTVMLAGNAAVHFVFAMVLLSRSHPGARAGWTAALAIGYAGAGWLARALAPRDRLLRASLLGASVAAAAIAIPLQFHGFALATGWGAEGVVLMAIGSRLRSPATRTMAAVVSGLGLIALLAGFRSGEYVASRVILSFPSLQVAVQIALVSAVAYLLSRDADPAVRIWYPAAAITANALAVVWLSAEAGAHFPAGPGGPLWQPLQFSLSAIWGLYAGVLLATGIAAKLRWARLTSLSLFGLTIAKMLAVDLWTLTTGQRVLGFIGLGALLLACSVLYHRFKELIIDRPEEVATG